VLQVNKLWALDYSRLTPNKDYEIELQGYTNHNSRTDKASRPLFKSIKSDVFTSNPTFQAFIALFDNYERDSGKKEVGRSLCIFLWPACLPSLAHLQVVTAQELVENRHFLDLIMQTEVMKYTHQVRGRPSLRMPSHAPDLISGSSPRSLPLRMWPSSNRGWTRYGFSFTRHKGAVRWTHADLSTSSWARCEPYFVMFFIHTWHLFCFAEQLRKTRGHWPPQLGTACS
jgi:hypothetical protein